MGSDGRLQRLIYPGRYRLRDGKIGTYLDACRECLDYWKQQRGIVAERIRHFQQEIKKPSKP